MVPDAVASKSAIVASCVLQKVWGFAPDGGLVSNITTLTSKRSLLSQVPSEFAA
jgi:hypothetical protein